MKKLLPLFFCLIPIIGWAKPTIILKTDVSPKEITIGDLIQYQLTVTVSPDVGIHPFDPTESLGEFELRSIDSLPPKPDSENRIIHQHNLVLTVFSTGTQTIPSLPIKFSTSPTSLATLETDAFEINVRSVLEEKGDQGNIYPPRGLVTFRSYVWLWILLGLLLAGGGIFWFVHSRKKRKLLSGESKKPQIPPEEEAWEKLLALEDEKLIDQGRTKDFYIRLSSIIRVYIERRYHCSTLDKTTSELFIEFRKLNFPSEYVALLRGFFDNGDLVKFAKVTPPAEEIDKDLNRIKKFITDTTPKPIDREVEASLP